MPIFDFNCEKCKVVEEHVIYTSDETIVCPKCKKPMHKNIAPTRFSFNFAVGEGVWEKDETGQEKYKGRGGRRVPVHDDGTPIES